MLTFFKVLVSVGAMKNIIKVRKLWGMVNPCTRRIDSGKLYNRKKKFKKSLTDGEC